MPSLGIIDEVLKSIDMEQLNKIKNENAEIGMEFVLSLYNAHPLEKNQDDSFMIKVKIIGRGNYEYIYSEGPAKEEIDS